MSRAESGGCEDKRTTKRLKHRIQQRMRHQGCDKAERRPKVSRTFRLFKTLEALAWSPVENRLKPRMLQKTSRGFTTIKRMLRIRDGGIVVEVSHGDVSS